MNALASLNARLRYRVLRTPAAQLVKSARKIAMRETLRRRKSLMAQLPESEQVSRCAVAIEERGFAQLDSVLDDDLLGDIARATALALAANDDRTVPDGVSRKAFWSRPLDAELVDGKMPVKTPFTQIALQPLVLALMGRVLGTLPLLDYVLLTVSNPVEGSPSQSQLWHRDHDDVRTIKLFIYLSDVSTTADGPFCLIPGPASDTIRQPLRSHTPDSWLFRRVDPSEMEQIIAPELSVFAVETSRCLHMGSRVAPGHGRTLFTATYTTAPRIFAGESRFVDAPEETELVRAVLGQELV